MCSDPWVSVYSVWQITEGRPRKYSKSAARSWVRVPLDRRACVVVEVVHVEQPEHRRVVVAHADRAAELADHVDARARVGAVTDQVADLHPVVDLLGLHRAHDRRERLDVAVNVPENADAHQVALREIVATDASRPAAHNSNAGTEGSQAQVGHLQRGRELYRDEGSFRFRATRRQTSASTSHAATFVEGRSGAAASAGTVLHSGAATMRRRATIRPPRHRLGSAPKHASRPTHAPTYAEE
jgi:hypothetical protein